MAHLGDFLGGIAVSDESLPAARASSRLNECFDGVIGASTPLGVDANALLAPRSWQAHRLDDMSDERWHAVLTVAIERS